MSARASSETDDVSRAFVAVARAIADALEIGEVWKRISDACRAVVPFEGMGVARLEGDDVHLIAAAHGLVVGLEEQRFKRSEFSPALWPDSDDFVVLIADANRELDPRFPVDRFALARGVQSLMRLPLGRGTQRFGSLMLSSTRPSAFTETHARQLALVAEMITVAIAHQRLADEASRARVAQERAERLEDQVRSLTEELEALHPHQTVGRSTSWKEVLGLATKVAPTETTVLLTGESGTGKEVIARLLHRASPRQKGPFVALNSAALAEHLLESELFGHEKGAFTGASAARSGKIEQARGGVLFLDEIGEMSASVQAKLLRVLQEREYQRVGGTRTLDADVRVIAATNVDLAAAMTRGAFREDLYYRLAVFEIALPPLRERRDDILLLAQTFLEQLGKSVGRSAAGISDDARATLLAHAWPGNVRELRNAIERAVILCEGGLITSAHLPILVRNRSEPPGGRAPTVSSAAHASQSLEATERQMIVDALIRTGNNKSRAARLLGLTRAQLRSRIEKHGISLVP
jgi:transcriptional regulator with GAF, ATPase, and Fis domain